ncbi:apoptosis antagonizing transcription factor [Calliopsis andreniformis]|uniref:apoptosis antagonizing transcription factor n=1 Tax=Calliopsis andreniformis TaxID=337506 RepID=UPI003FCECB05
MASKMKKLTLADKINSLVTTKPTNFDSDDDADDTKAKVVDRYDESDNSESNFPASEIRRRNINLLDQLDKRYVGKKVSRKDIYNSDDDLHDVSESDENEKLDSVEEEEEEENDDNDNEKSMSIDNDDDDVADEDNVENEEDDVADEEDSDVEDEENDESDYSSFDDRASLTQYAKGKLNVEESNDESSDGEHAKNFQTMSHTNFKAEVQKGNCVRSQLKLWESLLEMRIQLQKCLVVSNQMPQYDVYQNFKEDAEYMKKNNENKDKLKLLLNNMLQLQSFLLKQYPETKNLSVQNKKRKAEESIDMEAIDKDEEIPSSTDEENENEDKLILKENVENTNKNTYNKKLRLEEYEKILNENHKSYKEYRNTVIQKWNDKTRIASGKFNKGTSETILKQIEFALNDKGKMYKRVQLKRSEYKIIGKMEVTNDDNEGRRVQEYDSEIYDDDDFYHQLLRDLIEYKSVNITDPLQLSKQWIQLQNMRRKMKRKIDTRATKGRRIRYDVHNKLVNFMAPININDTWSDQAKDELYNSLFGKIKSMNEEVSH